MKKLFILALFIQMILLIGCSSKEFSNKSTHENSINNTNEATNDNNLDTTDELNTIHEITYNSNIEEYNLLDLNISDGYDKLIRVFGEPTEKCYEVVGTFRITDQSLYTFMYYNNMIITVRNYFDENTYVNEQGVIEIDISSGDYKTQKGVKIGDSIDTVTDLYSIKYVFPYEENSNNDIVTMFYNRVNGLETYKKRDFIYDYGEIDKIAYIISDKKDEKHNSIPALVFLFSNDKVTHIILYNTIAL